MGSTNTHPNVEVLNRLNEAFFAEDTEAILACFGEDAVWSLAGNNPMSGEYRGPAEILEFLGRLGEETGGTLAQEDIAVFASDWGVVELIRVTGQRRGLEYDSVDLIAYQIEGDKIVNVIHRPDPIEADRFWG